MRNERWNDSDEIRRKFPGFQGNVKPKTAGPIILSDKGSFYYDDSESHILVDGRTGAGKSRCVSTTYALSVLHARESLICIDPKGDLYEKTGYLAEKTHRCICLDFRNPYKSKDKWNALLAPYQNYISHTAEKQDLAASQLFEIASGLYPHEPNVDPFWCESSASFFSGLAYALFEKATPEEVNISSISNMINICETRNRATILIKDFGESFPADSNVRYHLESYLSAPNDTRASIHSVSANGISVFSRSQGVLNLLCNDTIDINSIDVDKPLAVYVIIPDNTSAFNAAAAIFVSQITQHLIHLAHDKYGGRLPNKVNIILEELSSVGKSISNLPNLMVASRSRNIRLMLVLQNGRTQLEDVYSKPKAATIMSCIGLTFAFSTNSWDTLNELSQRCGERQIEINDHLVKEPLITASQLAAMPMSTVLVLIENRFKYITSLPFYDEVFDMTDWRPPIENDTNNFTSTPNFDMKEYVNSYIEAKHAKELDELFQRTSPSSSRSKKPSTESVPVDIEKIAAEIDRKIAELEAEEEMKKRCRKKKQYKISILNIRNCKHSELVKVISSSLKIPLVDAKKMLENIPIELQFKTKKEADSVFSKICEMGCAAIINVITD